MSIILRLVLRENVKGINEKKIENTDNIYIGDLIRYKNIF